MRRAVLLMVVGTLLLTMVAGVASAKTFVCTTVPCEGTNNADQIGERNGSVRDIIKGKGGNDVINASRSGNDEDRLFGGSGNDRLNADDGDARDILDCGEGNDDTAIADAGDRVLDNCENVIIDGVEQ